MVRKIMYRQDGDAPDAVDVIGASSRHNDIVVNDNIHAGNTDELTAGLLKDLKRRGLLDSTLVLWADVRPAAERTLACSR
jgi:hypothetical protein